MPSSYVHEQVAKAAWQQLCAKRPQAQGVDHRAALLAGAQGPDPLFFTRIYQGGKSSHIRQWGETLHTCNTGAFLRSLVKSAQGKGALQGSYALGFLTHYATDTVFHPYVYAKSAGKDGLYDNTLHGLMEAALDCWLYRQQHQSGIPRHMQGIAALSQPEKEQLGACVADAVAQAFGPGPVTTEAMVQGFNDCVLVAKALYSPTGFVGWLLRNLARFVGKHDLVASHIVPRKLPRQDVANQACLSWASPWDRKHMRTDPVTGLMEQAIERATELLVAAWGLWEEGLQETAFDEVVGDLHYSSGLPWQQTEQALDGRPMPGKQEELA